MTGSGINEGSLLVAVSCSACDSLVPAEMLLTVTWWVAVFQVRATELICANDGLALKIRFPKSIPVTDCCKLTLTTCVPGVRVASRAFRALSLPPVSVTPDNADTGSTLSRMICLTSTGVSVGSWANMSPATPAT